MVMQREMVIERSKFDNLLYLRRLNREMNTRKLSAKKPHNKLRVKSGRFHVYVRGFDSRRVFIDDEDHMMFLIIVNEVLKEMSFIVYGYILMVNHFHLLIETNELPMVMGQIMFRYSLWYKRKHPAVVKVFETPYGSSPIYNPVRFKDCFLYILSNAKRARMCEKHEDYFWSSANQYFAKRPHLLDSYIEVNKSYALQEYSSAETFNQDVNTYNPFKKDGKRTLRWYVSDSQVADFFKRLVNSRDFKKLDNSEIEYIIRSLRYDCSATYYQIRMFTNKSLHYIRKVLATP